MRTWYLRLSGRVRRIQILSFRKWLATKAMTRRMLSRFPVRYSPASRLASVGSRMSRSCSASSAASPAVRASVRAHTARPAASASSLPSSNGIVPGRTSRHTCKEQQMDTCNKAARLSRKGGKGILHMSVMVYRTHHRQQLAGALQSGGGVVRQLRL